MKKLRADDQTKNLFIDAIIKKLFDEKTSIESFSIEPIKKEFSNIPKDIKKPIIQIGSEAYIQMLELVNQSATECSWHGLVYHNKEENRYFIYDILVFPQINSATATTTNEKDFAAWQTKLIMNPDFPIEQLRMHGHSHVNMQVFSSGVDDAYQEDLITKVEDGDYYIFLIMNKKMEMCAFLYDFDQQIMFETKDLDIRIGTECDIREWAKKELKEKAVTERKIGGGVIYNYGMNSRISANTGFHYDDEYDVYYGFNEQAKTNRFKEQPKTKRKKGGKKNGSK